MRSSGLYPSSVRASPGGLRDCPRCVPAGYILPQCAQALAGWGIDPGAFRRAEALPQYAQALAGCGIAPDARTSGLKPCLSAFKPWRAGIEPALAGLCELSEGFIPMRSGGLRNHNHSAAW